MTLHVQLMTMLTMIVGGVYLGFALETYRRLTRGYRKYPFFLYALEMGFWLIQTAVLYYALFMVNEGALRVYVFLACLLGYSIYIVIFQRSFQKVLEGCIRAVKVAFGWVSAVVQTMLIQPVLWVLSLLLTIVRGLASFLLWLVSYPFHWLLRFIYWLMPDIFLKKISQTYIICSTIVNKLIKYIKKILQKWR